VNKDGSTTMTGDLNFQGGKRIKSGDSGANVLMQSDGTLRLNVGQLASLDLQATGGITLSGTAFSLKLSSFAAPVDDNTVSLGQGSRRWKDLYVASGTINTSDEHQKKDISALDEIKDFFMALNPVKYRYIDGTSGRMHHGLGAREVEQAMLANGLSDIDFAGLIKSPDEKNEGEYIYGLRYTEFIPMLIKMVQDQQRKIDVLEARGSL